MQKRARLFRFRFILLAVAALACVAVPKGAQSQIFSDGFESGDTSAWSVVRETIPGSLEVTPGAALDGTTFGLEVAGGSRAWVESREPDREKTVSVHFFFDPDNWEMLVKARVEILRFNAQGRRHHLRLVLRQVEPGLFRLGLLVRGNQGSYAMIGGGLVLAGEPNAVEVEWQAASAPNATDGSAALYINGVLEAQEPSIANGRLDVRSIQLGLVGGNVAGTRGSFYLDEYQSFRTLAP